MPEQKGDTAVTMRADKSVTIEEVLESILRGAAKTLGCNSANLIVFNEFRKEVRIQVGLLLERQRELVHLEGIIGCAINDLVFTFEQSRETDLFRAWRERAVIEVSSLVALARGAFPEELLVQADTMIGDHKFLFVPAMGETNCYGVIIFEKIGTHPFSPQQRELLIMYANRIGEIIENDTRSFHFSDRAQPHAGKKIKRLLIDGNGGIISQVEGSGEIVVLVEDSGCGLKSDPDDCFSPFFSTKPNGTGLGLTVCRKILEAQSGSITLENREGGGCRASVVLPLRIY